MIRMKGSGPWWRQTVAASHLLLLIGIISLLSNSATADSVRGTLHTLEQSKKVLLTLEKCHYSPDSLTATDKDKLTLERFKVLAQKKKGLCGIELPADIDLLGAELQGLNLRAATLKKANLVFAKLQNANLSSVDFQQADLGSALLQGANLRVANLQGSFLFNSNLQNANLSLAKLQGADLHEAKLQGADLSHAEFGCINSMEASTNSKEKPANSKEKPPNSKAKPANSKEESVQKPCTDISRALFYGPECITNKNHQVSCNENKLVFANLAGAKGIKSLVYDYSDHYYFPATLFPLREHLRKNGHEREAKEITYVIAHGAIEEALYKHDANKQEANKHDAKALDAPIATKIGAYFRYYAFDLTVEFGVNPSGAINILGFMIIIGTLIYFLFFCLALAYPERLNGTIMLIKPKDKLRDDNETLDITEGEFYAVNVLKPIRDRQLAPDVNDVEALTLSSDSATPPPLNYRQISFTFTYIFGHALWFSILSSFHFGWRDLNIGNWLTRLQPTVFAYKPTGIFRTLSGLQSLLCIYFVALFMLSYFGHPWG